MSRIFGSLTAPLECGAWGRELENNLVGRALKRLCLGVGAHRSTPFGVEPKTVPVGLTRPPPSSGAGRDGLFTDMDQDITKSIARYYRCSVHKKSAGVWAWKVVSIGAVVGSGVARSQAEARAASRTRKNGYLDSRKIF
jgi:hypothetical protein